MDAGPIWLAALTQAAAWRLVEARSDRVTCAPSRGPSKLTRDPARGPSAMLDEAGARKPPMGALPHCGRVLPSSLERHQRSVTILGRPSRNVGIRDECLKRMRHAG